MKALTEKFSLPILGLILAGLGVIAPIAWDWWNKRSQITLDVKSIATVVSSSQPIKKLEFTYDGQKIQTLNRIHMEIRNTGRAAISKDDVLAPITIALANGKILEAQLTKKYPDNLDVLLFKTETSITASISLLNPNEYLEVDILTTSDSPRLEASARIKGISKIEQIDSATATSIRFGDAIAALAFSLLGFLFAALTIAFGKDLLKKRRVLVRVNAGAIPLLTAATLAEARADVYESFGFLVRSDREGLDRVIDGKIWPLDEAGKNAIQSDIQKIIERDKTLGPFLTSAVITVGLTALAVARLT
jgi:hypothetical protein